MCLLRGRCHGDGQLPVRAASACFRLRFGNGRLQPRRVERAVELDPIPQTLTILADAYDRTGEVQLALDLRERAAKMIIPQGQSKVKQPRRVVM